MKILHLILLLVALFKMDGRANPAVINFATISDCVCTVTFVELDGRRICLIDSIIVGELTKKRFETIKKEENLNRFKTSDKCIIRFANRGASYGITIIEKNGDFTWDIGKKEQKFNVAELEKVFKDGRIFKE